VDQGLDERKYVIITAQVDRLLTSTSQLYCPGSWGFRRSFLYHVERRAYLCRSIWWIIASFLFCIALAYDGIQLHYIGFLFDFVSDYIDVVSSWVVSFNSGTWWATVPAAHGVFLHPTVSV
jgi:hypothetical protein